MVYFLLSETPSFKQQTNILVESVNHPTMNHSFGQITVASAEVSPNGGLVGECSQNPNPLDSGLGNIAAFPRFFLLNK